MPRPLLLLALCGCRAFCADTVNVIALDGNALGRAFEGVGALSAGASSRMLIDYPEPQRSDILDYLFKPMFGANLHHLKVEIGGDVNSTDGSEPSHARTRDELLHPKPEYYSRGYEWWLMKEAKRRNPGIILEGLQWGAPGWIGNGAFYSQDNADFLVSFVRGAKIHHGLDINYVGIWNERDYDIPYIKLLRRTLDRAGLSETGIDAGDHWEPEKKWLIAEDIRRDPELRAAIAAVNAHSTEQINNVTPIFLGKLNVPIWTGEGHAYGGDWHAAMKHARYNRAYPAGNITKIVTWSLISSYPDYLPAPGSGPMKANTPWSGYYEVQPPVWVMAHFNQFAQPGWRYLQRACRILREGASVTALKDQASEDYSIIIETTEAHEPLTLTFQLSGPLSGGDLAVWRTTFKQDAFIRLDDVHPAARQFSVVVQPASIYSLTTSRGQSKAKASAAVPPDAPFPLPFTADFEDTPVGQCPRFFLDQHGVFEVTPRAGGRERCLTQVIPEQGIVWRKCNYPHTVLGDIGWKNYRFSADFSLPQAGKAKFWIRLQQLNGMGAESNAGYGLEIDDRGKWSLNARAETMRAGLAGPLGTGWHSISLLARDDSIAVTLDGHELARIVDGRFKAGVIGLGTDWNAASFDNIRIEAVDSRSETRND